MQLSKESQETQEVLNGFFQGSSQNDPEAIAGYLAEDVHSRISLYAVDR